MVGSVLAAAAAAAAELRALRFVYQVRYLESFQAHVCPPLCSHRALCSWSGPVVLRLAGWLTVNFVARELSQWPCDVVCVWSSPGRADFGGAGDM